MAECDDLDGAKDGLLSNPRACNFDPRDIACGRSDNRACLAPEKAAAVAKAMAGPRDSRGIQVYPGFPYDPGVDDPGFLAGILNSANNPPEGAPSSGMLTIDVDAQVMEWSRGDLTMGDTLSPKMSTFAGEGHKQIFYHGAADPWFSANETIRYYEEMADFNGGLQTVRDWSRLFYVPGMSHCAGGQQTLDSFDMLSAIVDWVENGKAPTRVTATGRSMPGVSRPLCPWPEYPRYNGSGDINDAANFSCKTGR